MLVLSRKVGEEIIIGDDIIINVLKFKRGNVVLGIDAPKDITILRGELIDAVADNSEFNSTRRRKEDKE